ncbi:Ionotropic receptor 41a6 [Blattella germanica]|nr:Ionotropic receptor 41a6 [Blattella germanica]
MLKNLSLWLFLTFLGMSISQINVEKEVLTKSLGEFVFKFINRDFSGAYCIGVITEEDPAIVDYIPKYLYRYHFQIGGQNSPIQEVQDSSTYDYRTLNNETILFETFLVQSLNSGCPLYVMQVSNPRAVIRCFIRSSRRAMFRLSRFYIFLPVIKNGEIISVNEDIFFMKEMNCLPDLVVCRIVQNTTSTTKNLLNPKGLEYFDTKSENITNNYDYLNRRECSAENLNPTESTNTSFGKFVIEFRTHKFVGSNRSESVLLDVWIRGTDTCYGYFQQSGIIFPDKIRNVEGRQVILITWYYPPFIIMDFNAKPNLFDGIEFRIIQEFMKFINATFRVTTDPGNYWGEGYENGTGDGVLGFVAMDKADIGFSAYYSWPKGYRVLDFATPHMRSSVTMITPRPSLKPGWLVPLMPFDGVMWGAVAFSLLGCSYTLYGLQKISDALLGRPEDRLSPYSTLDYSALRSYAMLLNQGPVFEWDSSIPRHVPARHFVGWFQFMGEVISDTYNAGLASVLSAPRYEPPIETIHDLAVRDVKWGANHISWIWSIQEDEHPDLQKVTSNFRLHTEDQMIRIGSRSGDMAFGLERLQGGHFTTEPHINEATVSHRRIMKGTLYWSHLYFLLRKGSPYMRHFNTLVRRVREAGLPFYWEGDVIRHYMSERLQVQIVSSKVLFDDTGPIRLNITQLQGPFIILGFGLMAAFLSFLAEHFFALSKKNAVKFSKKTVTKKNMSRHVTKQTHRLSNNIHTRK